MKSKNNDIIISGTGSIYTYDGNIYINSSMIGPGLTYSGNVLSATGTASGGNTFILATASWTGTNTTTKIYLTNTNVGVINSIDGYVNMFVDAGGTYGCYNFQIFAGFGRFGSDFAPSTTMSKVGNTIGSEGVDPTGGFGFVNVDIDASGIYLNPIYIQSITGTNVDVISSFIVF